MSVILPPAMLGILGGGQLGRMFAVAAKTMGYQVMVLDPDPDAPAFAFADVALCLAYDDPAALAQLAERCAAVTTEFENVSAEAMTALARHTQVSPSGACVAIAQNRIAEKSWINKAGLPTTAWLPIESLADLGSDISAYLPGILKTARFGYDGKGQQRVASRDDVLRAFEAYGQVPCILERQLALELELSAIVARSASGQQAVFPVAENRHQHGILDMSLVPARIEPTLAEQMSGMARQLAEALDYVGVLTIEFFVLANGQLVVNEMAPRPHNSGHYTLDACITDQFQQQVRTLCGLPPGATDLTSPVVMVNLLGELWPAEGEPDWQVLLDEPRLKLHLYGKRVARPGRKMGHFSLLAPTVEQAEQRAQQLMTALKAHH